MRFLSVGDRKASALVNRQWYEASLDPALQTNTVFHLLTPFTSGSTVQKFGLRKSPNLILNDMDGSSRSKEVVKKACQHLGQHLQSLSLKGSDITEGTFMVIIPHCCNLRKLDLSLCNSLFLSGNLLRKPNDFQAAEKSLVNVRELNLGSLRHLSDCVFNRLVTAMPNVEKLSLSGCTISYEFSPYDKESKTRASTSVLTFVNIKAFLEKQGKKLTSLNLSKTGLPGSSLRELAAVPGITIRELNIAGNRDVDDDDILALVKQQNGLTSLDVAMCGELTSQTVLHIQTYVPQMPYLNFSKFRELVCLRLNMCTGVTDQSLVAIATNVPSLEELSISQCHQVTDDGVTKVVKRLQRLTFLDISCNDKLTNCTLASISQYCHCLQKLDVSLCSQMSHDALDKLQCHLPHLVSLQSRLV
uniref:F-box domain-containing protein n=1 Tax=Branchiostoma floridae TaxID=7739 RepID=C3ZTZ1_BRAFL|eukprot:XP_002588022.1 hypothetical protein BRAFLDRAFT_89008 [Branchiostoma floridae]